MTTEIYFSSRNHATTLIKNLNLLLKNNKTIEVHPKDEAAFSKAGAAIAASDLNAVYEIVEKDDKPIILIRPKPRR